MYIYIYIHIIYIYIYIYYIYNIYTYIYIHTNPCRRNIRQSHGSVQICPNHCQVDVQNLHFSFPVCGFQTLFLDGWIGLPASGPASYFRARRIPGFHLQPVEKSHKCASMFHHKPMTFKKPQCKKSSGLVMFGLQGRSNSKCKHVK